MTERHEFVRLFDSPKVFRGKVFQAFWKENSGKNARLGITIKGRLSSVWRMRLKRVVREWFRTRKVLFGEIDINIVVRIPPKVDLVFLGALKKNLEEWKPNLK